MLEVYRKFRCSRLLGVVIMYYDSKKTLEKIRVEIQKTICGLAIEVDFSISIAK